MKFMRGISSKKATRGSVRRGIIVIKVDPVKPLVKAEGFDSFDIDFHMAPELDVDQAEHILDPVETTTDELKEVVKDFWKAYEAEGLKPEQCADQVMSEMLGSPWLLKHQEAVIFGYLAELYGQHKDAQDSFITYLKGLEAAAANK